MRPYWAEDPYGGHPPFVKGSATSKEAAESVETTADSMRNKVLLYIKGVGFHGATDDEIEVALKLGLNTIRPRRRELVLQGKVRDSGKRRPTRSGRAATIWELTGEYTQTALL